MILAEKSKRNYSAGLRIYCADRTKVIQEFKNLIAAGDFKWIFERNGEGTEQLRANIDLEWMVIQYDDQ